MKSDELMIEFKAQKAAAENAVLDEARLVRHMMAEFLELGLPVWLGEFYNELESAGVPGEFEFHPGGNYEADAQLKLLRMWRGIGVQIRVTASKKRGAYGQVGRVMKADMKFVWEEERLWGKNQYRKEIAVNLPFKESDGQDKWIYVAASAPVEVKALGEALVEAHAVEAERSAVRAKAAVEREESNKLAHERAIERADDFTEMLECYEKALTAFANDAARWKAAYEQRTGELGAKLADEEQFAKEVFCATTWLENWKAILDANREKLIQVQAQWAHPLTCYVLEYGIVAEDDGGDEGMTKYVETRQMYVDACTADEHENWFEVGRNNCVRVSHPVRVWMMTFEHDDTAPNELIRKLWVRDSLEYIKTWVTDDMAFVMADLADAKFSEFPALNMSVSRRAWQRALLDGNYGEEYSVRQELGKLIDGADLREVE